MFSVTVKDFNFTTKRFSKKYTHTCRFSFRVFSIYPFEYKTITIRNIKCVKFCLGKTYKFMFLYIINNFWPGTFSFDMRLRTYVSRFYLFFFLTNVTGLHLYRSGFVCFVVYSMFFFQGGLSHSSGRRTSSDPS